VLIIAVRDTERAPVTFTRVSPKIPQRTAGKCQKLPNVGI